MKTFWENNHEHQSLAAKLCAMIPTSGQVNQPRKNRSLEKYRKAANCYHDLYNNGLSNRVIEFNRVFGIPSSQYRYHSKFSQHLYDKVEAKMTEFVLNAAKEQGIL